MPDNARLISIALLVALTACGVGELEGEAPDERETLAASCGASVTGFTLIDADRDQPVASHDPLSSGATLALASLPKNLNIRANVSGVPEKVRFDFDGTIGYRNESMAPYALGGDLPAGNYYPLKLGLGSHSLSATPYVAGVACATTTITFSVVENDPPPPSNAPKPKPTAWWKSTFVNGVSRYMRRPWNVGYSFYTHDGHVTWEKEMGAKADTIMGGLTGDDRENTWEGLCGGKPTDPPVAPPRTVPHVASSYHVNGWTCPTCPKDVWAILGLPTVPRYWKPAGKTFLEGWQQVAAGAYDAWYEKMGQRMRAHIVAIGRNPSRVVLRPNWELNQDTAFRPNFWENGGYVKLYNRMMKRFADSFRKGYGERVPIILAMVEGTQGCLRVDPNGPCNQGTIDSFLTGDAAGIYDLVEVSCHPGIWHAKTLADLKLWVEGPMPLATNPTKSNNFACEDAFRAARRHGLGAALTEWSPRNEIEYYVPLAPTAVDLIADMLERNQDILAFSNAFHVSFILENWNPTQNPTFGTVWKQTVQRHKARFRALP